MQGDERYNGWTNRETWAVALHINNDQGWQESVHEELREYVGNFEPGDDFDRPNSVAAGEIIRENVEMRLDPREWAERTHAGIAVSAEWFAIRGDIGSLWRVDWTELGAAFLSDLDES